MPESQPLQKPGQEEENKGYRRQKKGKITVWIIYRCLTEIRTANDPEQTGRTDGAGYIGPAGRQGGSKNACLTKFSVKARKTSEI